MYRKTLTREVDRSSQGRNKMHLDKKFKCHTAHTSRREERVRFVRFLTAQVETIIITMGFT